MMDEPRSIGAKTKRAGLLNGPLDGNGASTATRILSHARCLPGPLSSPLYCCRRPAGRQANPPARPPGRRVALMAHRTDETGHE